MLAIVAITDASHARPTPCSGEPAECGKQEFGAGIKAYQAGEFRLAALHFERAHGHRAHPVVLFNWALANTRDGKPVEALKQLEQVLADEATPSELRPKVEAERDKAARNVARVVVDAAGTRIELFIDDVARPGDPPVGVVNPGPHQVRVLIDGKLTITRGVDVRAGETLRLTVDQSREIVVGGAGAGGTSGAGGGSAGGDGGSTAAGPKPLAPVWFYVSVGATVVLGGATVWSGLDTKSAFDDYERDLPRLSQAQVNSRVDDGHAKETRTNVLLGATSVAGVATAALGLFFVDWSGGGKGNAQALSISPQGATYLRRF
jgi:hypothetical protein